MFDTHNDFSTLLSPPLTAFQYGRGSFKRIALEAEANFTASTSLSLGAACLGSGVVLLTGLRGYMVAGNRKLPLKEPEWEE